MSVSKIERRLTNVLMAIPLSWDSNGDGRYYYADGTFTKGTSTINRTPIIIMRGNQSKAMEPDYCSWDDSESKLYSGLGVTTYSNGRLTVDCGSQAWSTCFMLIPEGKWIPS